MVPSRTNLSTNDPVALFSAMYGGGCEGCSPDVTDADVESALYSRLDADPDVPTASVQVTVERGWVTLSGEVGSWTVRERAEAVALHEEGVTCLEDRLAVIAG